VRVTRRAVKRILTAALGGLGAATFLYSFEFRVSGFEFDAYLTRDSELETRHCHTPDSRLQTIGASRVSVSGFQSNQQSRGSQPKPDSSNKHNARPEETRSNAPSAENREKARNIRYSYEFTQPKFYLRHILLEHDASGHGKITFQRLNEDTSISESVELSSQTLTRIQGLWEQLRFLDSSENYQSDRQFPHLGTMRLQMQDGVRKRTSEFNWTNNRDASALVNEYRRVADQALLIFDISVARENQPLNAPKLMELLESLLKRDGLSDPHQLVPLLHEITTDEHLPLIARNHAERLLKRIEK
jgi:hypothetical protein